MIKVFKKGGKMFKKLILFVFLGLFTVNTSGCVAILAGAAGGAGTAVWLSGKLSEEVKFSYDDTYRAAQRAFSDLGLTVSKDTRTEKTAQIKGLYTDGRTVWVDVHSLEDKLSRIEVRVGVAGDEIAARKIMDRIKARL